LKFLRSRIEHLDNNNGTYTVNLSRVIPKNKTTTFTSKITLTKEEFEDIFDPYKQLKNSRILHWNSFRKKQEENREKVPFVEHIEDLFFFEDQGLADFIRSAVDNYHTYKATAYSFILGFIFALGITLASNPSFYWATIPQIPAQLDMYKFVGLVICLIVFIISIFAAWRQSDLRLKEAIANWYLLLRLKVPEEDG
jgi:hypothetical protein